MDSLQYSVPCCVRVLLCGTGALLLVALLVLVCVGIAVPLNVSIPISGFALGGLHLAFRRADGTTAKLAEKKTPNRR